MANSYQTKGKNITSSRALFIVLMAFFCCHISAQTIVGSAHDFTDDGFVGEICIVCHSPHNTLDEIGAPLWNHEVTTAVYTVYSSPTFESGWFQGIHGVTKLCLSCHDGTVAVDNYGSVTAPTHGINEWGSNRNLSTDLSDDHPVGIAWKHQVAGAGDGSSGCTFCHSGATFSGQPGELVLFDNLGNKTIECATCHDVHNNVANDHLLREPMTGSRLCIICHSDKGATTP